MVVENANNDGLKQVKAWGDPFIHKSVNNPTYVEIVKFKCCCFDIKTEI